MGLISNGVNINGSLEAGKEPTGFDSPELVVTSYNKLTREVTLVQTSPARWRGNVISELIDGWISEPHPDTTDIYFLYYNGTDFVWSTTSWTFDMLQIAFIDVERYAIRESHGLMQWQSHRQAHLTNGTFRSSGGDFSAYTLNSTTAANRRPSISEAVVNDEDLQTIIPAKTDKLYTIRYLTSANTTNYTVDASDIIPLSTNNPYYNQFNGSAWVQTLLATNQYAAIFVIAVPCTADLNSQKYRLQYIQPQTASTTLSTIQSLNINSVNWGNTVNLVPEFVAIEKIIIRYTASNWIIISSEKLTGTSNNIVAIQGSFLSAVTTNDTLTGTGTTANPLGVVYKNGFIDYADSATTTTPLSYTTGDLKITCDGLGATSLNTYAPLNVTSLFNTTTNQFDFSQLALGDEVLLRTSLSVTTTATNQEFSLHLNMSIGSNPYSLSDGTYFFKTAGVKPIGFDICFYIGNTDTLNNPAELIFTSDAAASIVVNGFYISVRRR